MPEVSGSSEMLARPCGSHPSGARDPSWREGEVLTPREGTKDRLVARQRATGKRVLQQRGQQFCPPKLPLWLDSGCSRGPGSCVGRTYTCRLARSVAHVQERTLQVAVLPPRHTGRRLPGDLAGARSTPTVSPFSMRRGVFSRRRTPCAALSRGQKVPERWSVASAPVAAEVPGEALS